MYYVFAFLVGLVTGGFCFWLYVMDGRTRLKRRVDIAETRSRQATERASQKEREFEERRTELALAIRAKEEEIDKRSADLRERLQAEEIELRRRVERAASEVRAKAALVDSRESELQRRIAETNVALERRVADLTHQQAEFDARVISYKDLQAENAILRRDLEGADVHLNKLSLDVQHQADRQKALDDRANELAKRYLAETVKSVIASVGPNNFEACKKRLLDAIERCRDIGFDIPAAEEQRLVGDLRAEFEREVRKAFAREEQARIKAQMREEEKLRREVDREVKQAEREKLAVQAALDQALAQARDQHSAEVQHLQARLAEAEAKATRALSMAQQTKAGNVYVISNIGSFGESVFKIGMTRRLEPLDRIRELGDASVPFPFDVHMMISCTDAPALENALHRELHKLRLNRTNPRKEFFRTDLESIANIVRQHHGHVDYVAEPEALEYRQSLTISDQDADFIESVYDAADEDDETKSVTED